MMKLRKALEYKDGILKYQYPVDDGTGREVSKKFTAIIINTVSTGRKYTVFVKSNPPFIFNFSVAALAWGGQKLIWAPCILSTRQFFKCVLSFGGDCNTLIALQFILSRATSQGAPGNSGFPLKPHFSGKR